MKRIFRKNRKLIKKEKGNMVIYLIIGVMALAIIGVLIGSQFLASQRSASVNNASQVISSIASQVNTTAMSFQPNISDLTSSYMQSIFDQFKFPYGKTASDVLSVSGDGTNLQVQVNLSPLVNDDPQALKQLKARLGASDTDTHVIIKYDSGSAMWKCFLQDGTTHCKGIVE